MSRNLRALLLTLLAGIACENAGGERVLGVSATAVIDGVVYFDRNGNGVLDSPDTALANVAVRIVAMGTRDTVQRATGSSNGTFRFSNVPVGRYRFIVDTTSVAGDSLRITRVDSSTITLLPDDTTEIRVAASFPEYTIAQARKLPAGKKAFIIGVALNQRGSFGDSTMHLADTSGAVRLTAVRTLVVLAGDSVRVLAARSARDGQPTMDRGVVFAIATDAATPVHLIKGNVAAAADTGKLDAALVRVLNVLITDTSTVQGNRRLVVDDSSGPLVVRLDSIVGFRGTALLPDTVGARLDVVGLLVPTGSGAWMVKPRGPFDVVVR